MSEDMTIGRQHDEFKRQLNTWIDQLLPEEKALLDLKSGIYTFAPGRGNMIGEHIDYSGGMVSPVTIGPGCFCAAIPREDTMLKVVNLAGRVKEGESWHSSSVSVMVEDLFDEDGSLLPEEKARKLLPEKDSWAGLILGALYVLLEEDLVPGGALSGIQYLMLSNVPIASGLSSSAALEVSSLSATAKMLHVKLSGAEIARLAQRMEYALRGVPCGRMDQSAAALGKPHEVLSLDCTSWKSGWHSLPEGWTPLFVDTNMPRSLKKSAYAERRMACEVGLLALNKVRDSPVQNLCSLSPEEFEALSKKAKLNEMVKKRCKHAVEEQERVKQFMKALDRNAHARILGELLYASHDSLKELYEVSCPELDAVVDIARLIGLEGGIAGARMQGAGFGGCAIVLVRDDVLERVKDRIRKDYHLRTGRVCKFVSGSSPGAVEFGIHPFQA